MRRSLISSLRAGFTAAFAPVALIAFAPAALIAPGPALAQAQTFPSKTIRIVVPYPAGGGSDFVARLFGERLSKALNTPVIVDNKSGAAGSIGATEVAKADADGHTILLTINDPLVNNIALFKALPYNPREDFAFLGQILRSPALISANADLPVKTIDDLRKLAAQQQGKLSFGSWGVGGLGHLAGEALNRELKAGMVHVPQRGEGPVVTDLLGKTISIGFSSVGTARQHVQSGKITALAVMGRERSSALPNVPTMRESGFTDPLFETSVWMAMLVPAKTPQPVVQRLAAEIRTIANAPDVRATLVERGFEMMVTTPEQASANHRAELDVILKRIREFNIEPQ